MKYPQLDAQRFATGGAALVLTNGEGNCEVLLGKASAGPTATSGDVFIYVASVQAYEARTSLEGERLPSSWNARPNDDGTLSAGKP